MKHILLPLMALCATLGAQAQGLKDAYRDYWRMGVSVNQWEVQADAQAAARRQEHDPVAQASGNDQTTHWPIISKHFGWVTPENCMKSEVIHPKPGVYDFTLADQLVNRALADGMHVIGHCLVWHSQVAPWFFKDDEGNQISADELKKRLREHIFTVLGHFRGRVEGWDVVNEAFNDDGTLRRSKFYQILGEDFIPLAFQYAHEADPTIELYYNDYSLNMPKKIDGVVNFFRPLVAKGLPIHAIGMQGHLILDDQDYLTQYRHSIEAIKSIGLKAQFTELDLSVLPNPFGFSGANVSDRAAYNEALNPYKQGIPADVQAKADKFWVDFFQMLMPYKDDILRLTYWNLCDANSWKNGFPVRGRTDYPTLFDRQLQPKPAVQQLIELTQPKAEPAKKTKKKK